jgi:hypothetical protein
LNVASVNNYHQFQFHMSFLRCGYEDRPCIFPPGGRQEGRYRG